MKKHLKKILIFLTLILALGFVLSSIHIAFAAGTTDNATAIGTNDIEQNLQKVINVVLFFLQRFTWPIILMIGGLMNNDLLFSGGMRQTLLVIWTGVRDLVNILFVLSLILIAVMNIIGAAKDEYEVKKILPRFIIALIAVNFSFLLCKVALDAVNVISTGIFGLPVAQNQLSPQKNPQIKEQLKNELCPVLQSQKEAAAGGSASQQADKDFTQFCTGSKAQGYQLTKEAEQFFSSFNGQNASLILAINLQKVGTLTEVDEKGVRTVSDLSINSLFSAVFFIIYGTAYIALFVALLIRLVVLWLVIAISPLIALGFAIPAVKRQVLEGENNLLGLFKDHALIPVPVAIVMSIGMVMVSALKGIKPTSTLAISNTDLGALTTGMSTVQDILVGMASVAFIWMAVFQALAKGKAAGAVNFIKGAVQGVGNAVAKLPFYAPIIPVKGADGTVKPVSIASTMGALQHNPEEAMRRQAMEDQETLGFGVGPERAIDEIRRARDLKGAHEALAGANTPRGSSSERKVMKEYAEWLEKNPRYHAQIKLPPDYSNVKDLIKDLKENPEKIDLVEFRRKNDIGVAGPQGSTNVQKASELEKKAKAAGISEGALKGLMKAANDLDQAKSNTEVASAQSKLNQARKNIEEAVAASEKIKKPLERIDLNSGMISNTNATELRQFFNEIRSKTDENSAKIILDKALETRGIKERNQRETIVNTIANPSPLPTQGIVYRGAAGQASGTSNINPPQGNPRNNPPGATNPSGAQRPANP